MTDMWFEHIKTVLNIGYDEDPILDHYVLVPWVLVTLGSGQQGFETVLPSIVVAGCDPATVNSAIMTRYAKTMVDSRYYQREVNGMFD